MPDTEHMKPALEFSDVSFSYARDPVIEHLDLAVPAGSFFGLLGPNGAGKSTLFSLACAALRPDSGMVSVEGKNLSSWNRRSLARAIAVVPQHFEMSFPFTVLQVVLLGRTPHQGSLALDSAADVDIARRAMEATEVAHLAERKIHELSGGEQKRVLVAKAIAQEPRILLLDEPAAHLDIRHQVGITGLIDGIRKRIPLTVISAMHDLNLAAAYCTRVALIQNGKTACVGSVEEVMTYHKLKDVFQTEIYVGTNDLTGHRLFVPMVAPERPLHEHPQSEPERPTPGVMDGSAIPEIQRRGG
jgi:iron complex transport system ATP-binding protein